MQSNNAGFVQGKLDSLCPLLCHQLVKHCDRTKIHLRSTSTDVLLQQHHVTKSKTLPSLQPSNAADADSCHISRLLVWQLNLPPVNVSVV